MRLAEQAGRLEPAEDLLDELPLSLAHDVAGVARGAAIDRTRTIRGVLGHVRRHLQPAQTSHEIPGVIPFVGAHVTGGAARAAAMASAALARRTVAGVRRASTAQAMTVLHQDVTLVAQLGLVRLALAGQPRLGSVVEAWVALRRVSPWKFTVGLPGSSGGWRGVSLRWKLFSPATPQ